MKNKINVTLQAIYIYTHYVIQQRKIIRKEDFRMSRMQRGMCHEEDIQNILTKIEEIEQSKKIFEKADTELGITVTRISSK